jgi:signal transduction histidine kinase
MSTTGVVLDVESTVLLEAEMNRMLRLYGLSSLLGVLLAAALLFLVVRKVAIDDVVELAERSNIALAQSVLGLVKPDLVHFLQSAKDVNAGGAAASKLPSRLAEAINHLMGNPAVARLKIYNAGGAVVFSTKFQQMGKLREKNAGFESAMTGKVVSSLTYRDAVNPYDRETEDDNLIQTYIPVRSSATEPIVGVFEIYTDGNPLVARNQRAKLQILAGVGAILALLYVALLCVVRHASRVSERQQQTIRERTTALELLSAQMLGSEEEEKRRIALELQEGLAQTLCSIKVHLEDRLQRVYDAAEDRVIPILQSAIDHVRNLASRLRPSSLDELGLLPTIDWLCDTFERMHPDMRVDKTVALHEDDTPSPLKIVVYRVIESAFRNIAEHPGSGHVELGLRLAGDAIVLTLNHSPRDAGYLARQDGNQDLGFAKIQEQVALSGGSFEIKYNAAQGVNLRASWLRVSLQDALPDQGAVAQPRALARRRKV